MEKKKSPLRRLGGALGHEAADKRMDILRRIGEVGSISEAARGAGVSYKAAWQAIDTLSNLAGTALVQRAVGGSGGGGASLTTAGRQLLQASELLDQAREQVLDHLARAGGAALPGLGGLGLRTSMRNQLPCSVTALKGQGGAVRIALALADGTPLFARVTRESAQLLDLHAGQAVLALCKATAVTVVAQAEPASGRNLLRGRVTRSGRPAGTGELAMALDCGLQFVGFAAPGSGLRARREAFALLDESALVVAVSA